LQLTEVDDALPNIKTSSTALTFVFQRLYLLRTARPARLLAGNAGGSRMWCYTGISILAVQDLPYALQARYMSTSILQSYTVAWAAYCSHGDQPTLLFPHQCLHECSIFPGVGGWCPRQNYIASGWALQHNLYRTA